MALPLRNPRTRHTRALHHALPNYLRLQPQVAQRLDQPLGTGAVAPVGGAGKGDGGETKQLLEQGESFLLLTHTPHTPTIGKGIGKGHWVRGHGRGWRGHGRAGKLFVCVVWRGGLDKGCGSVITEESTLANTGNPLSGDEMHDPPLLSLARHNSHSCALHVHAHTNTGVSGPWPLPALHLG